MAAEEERLKILDMVEKGLISTEDAVQLLEALGEEEDALPILEAAGKAPSKDESAESFPAETASELQAFVSADEFSASEAGARAESTPFDPEPEVLSPAKPFDPGALKWRSFWWIPMWVGVGITVFAALMMYWALSASGFGFWFACTWFPFLLGIMVMALAWASRTARWLHVRVHQKAGQKPERISISLPIPLRLTAWALRTFGHKIPKMGETSLDEVIMALDATSPDAPFYVEVNEGDDGERVEVYIG